MKKHLLVLMPLLFLFSIGKSQTKGCGTMQNYEEMIKHDPSLIQKSEKIEIQTKEWLKKNGRMNFSSPPSVNMNKYSSQKNGSGESVQSLCGYDNIYYTTISAPTTVGEKASPLPDDCVFGGEYVTVTNMIAGNVYKISTCRLNNFDTQVTVYGSGGSYPAAHNDDGCGSQSVIYFNPLFTDDYDILIDEFNCLNNTICSSLEVELFYEPRTVITIPVVFHVIHNGEATGVGTNISTAQILSQLDVLNEDFRRSNTDILSTPSVFRGASDDALVEFCLAQQDEFGYPTTGIERIQGPQTSYTFSDFNSLVKPNTVWERDLYLNFWTCDINLSGYAQFPGGPASTDGVVILYDQVGNTGNVTAPFDLGRTATHEVGHWLNLRHTWGDAAGCSTDDSIPDTPLQDIATPIGSCPTFPDLTNSCSPNYPGTMFYNQMDYSGDACLTMFTVGQTSRMDAALFGPRASIINSQGCIPSTVSVQNNLLSKHISLYPTLSNGQFTLTVYFAGESEGNIVVYNTLGERVKDYFLNKTGYVNEIIDLSNNADGVYFVQVSLGSQTVTQKIILSK